MNIRVSRVGKISIFQVNGNMDSANRDRIIALAHRELGLQPGREIILHLEGVAYCSAGGLNVMSVIHEAQGRLKVAAPAPRVQQLLELTGLDKVYDIYSQLPDAVRVDAPVVNAHTHLELGWLDAYRPGASGTPFVPWITGISSKAIPLVGEENIPELSREAVEAGIEAMINVGTTEVGDISSRGISIEPLLTSGLSGVVYIEVIGATQEMAERRFKLAKELIEQWRPKERNGMRIGISIHTPYTSRKEYWEPWLDYIRKEALPLCIHVAESPAETQLFKTNDGAITEFNKQFNLLFDVKDTTPVAYLDEVGALDLKPLLVHSIHVTNEDIQRIKASGSSVVHCPRSNLLLQCGRMPLEKYLAADIPVYIGTDSLGSSPSLNVMEEVEAAVALHYDRVPAEKILSLIHNPLP